MSGVSLTEEEAGLVLEALRARSDDHRSWALAEKIEGDLEELRCPVWLSKRRMLRRCLLAMGVDPGPDGDMVEARAMKAIEAVFPAGPSFVPISREEVCQDCNVVSFDSREARAGDISREEWFRVSELKEKIFSDLVIPGVFRTEIRNENCVVRVHVGQCSGKCGNGVVRRLGLNVRVEIGRGLAIQKEYAL